MQYLVFCGQATRARKSIWLATQVKKGLISHGLAVDPELSRPGRDVSATESFAMQVDEPVLVGKHANAIGLNHIFAKML